MVHDGAGKYYAPNECAGITVITIVVQLLSPMDTTHCLIIFPCCIVNRRSGTLTITFTGGYFCPGRFGHLLQPDDAFRQSSA
jgi:hypothetical protein